MNILKKIARKIIKQSFDLSVSTIEFFSKMEPYEQKVSELRNLKITYQRIEKSEYFLDEFWNSKITDFFISCGLPFESYSSNDPLITIKDIELGGYSKKQFIGLINMKNDLQNYWEVRQENAYLKSKEVLDKLQAE